MAGDSVPAIDLLSLCLAAGPVLTGRLWQWWSFAPAIVLPGLAAGLLYLAGQRALGAAERARRGAEPAFFAAGMIVLAIALVSPLCRLASVFAWAHMVQHVLLVAVAPPLLVLGGAGRRMRAVLGPSGMRRSPPLGLLSSAGLYALGIWAWHIPGLYEAALAGPAMHLLMLASLLAAGLLFWSTVAQQETAPAERAGAVALVLLATMIHTGLLGAMLAFARQPWYPVHVLRAAGSGLSPADDQQLAGLIMWVPMGAIFLAAALMTVQRWLFGLPAAPRAR